MPKPPMVLEAKARNIKATNLMLAPTASLLQDLERSPYLSSLQLFFFSSAEEATVPIPPCPRCGSKEGIEFPGTGPHYAGLRCANCARFIKWLSKPGREA